MGITYLKKANKTPSTDDDKTHQSVQQILKDLEKRREQGILEISKKFDKYEGEVVVSKAKIEEAKDIPTVQVLDVAKVPERKSKPRRVLLVVTIFLVCLIGNSLVIISYVNNQFNH